MTIDNLASTEIDNAAAKGRSRKKGRTPSHATVSQEWTVTPQNAVEMVAAAGRPQARSRKTGSTSATAAASDDGIGSEAPPNHAAVGPSGTSVTEQEDAPPIPADTGAMAETARQTKKARVLGMLRQSGGASIAELMDGTGWQAHTVRAFLTGVRKDGKELIRTKDGASATRYRITMEG